MNIFREKKHRLKDEIERLQTEIMNIDPRSNEYAIVAANLATLYEAKSKGREYAIKLDTVVTGLFSLGAVMLIIYGEETRLLSKTALGFVIKGRV